MTRLLLLFLLVVSLGFQPGCNKPGASATAAQSDHARDDAAQEKDAPPSAANPAESADTQGDGRPVIVAFGDSLTAGYGAESGESYPDYLQRDLDRLGYKYRVVNLGISGNTTKDGLDRVPDVLSLHPAIAIVEFGGNDGLRGAPLNVTERNLDEIIRALQAAHIQVVLAGITLPRNYGVDYIHRFDAMYPTLAGKHNTPLLPFLLLHVYGTAGDMQADGVHATAKGNKQVAENVLQVLQPLLQR